MMVSFVTWQNALLGRDADRPVSFQVEIGTDGRFTYRYDLSRCGAPGDRALPGGALTDILSGASVGGNVWTTNAIPTNVTSMAFYPLSAEDAVTPIRAHLLHRNYQRAVRVSAADR